MQRHLVMARDERMSPVRPHHSMAVRSFCFCSRPAPRRVSFSVGPVPERPPRGVRWRSCAVSDPATANAYLGHRLGLGTFEDVMGGVEKWGQVALIDKLELVVLDHAPSTWDERTDGVVGKQRETGRGTMHHLRLQPLYGPVCQRATRVIPGGIYRSFSPLRVIPANDRLSVFRGQWAGLAVHRCRRQRVHRLHVYHMGRSVLGYRDA